MTGQHVEGDTMTHAGNLVLHTINPADTLRIQATIDDHSCSFLLDTGAAVTLLNNNLWECCKNSFQHTWQPWTQQRVIGVDGSTLQTNGTALVYVNFFEHMFQLPVIIVDGISEDAILGLDFLQQQNCCIDIEQKVLRFKKLNIAIPLQSKQLNHHALKITASMAYTTVVPPQSELLR